jgi:predicted RNA binding protein YcfA (HicA-like mRNA interferase family)
MFSNTRRESLHGTTRAEQARKPLTLSNPSDSDIMKVRDVVKTLEAEGWRLAATRGSHRQFAHQVKAGRVTVPGHPHDDVHPKTLRSIWRQAGLEKERG